MGKQYAFVGSWSFEPGPKGLSIYTFEPETAQMTYVKTLYEDISVGFQCMDMERRVLYLTDESGECRGDAVSGRALALKMGGADILGPLGEVNTFLPKPCYVSLDAGRRYALVAHHSGRNRATKLVRDAGGEFSVKTVKDDAGLILFRLNDDGSIGRACDACLTAGETAYGDDSLSHVHCIVPDPSGRLFLACDKGLDKIYSFSVDSLKDRLVLRHTLKLPSNSAPRYAAFHPRLPLAYVDFEQLPALGVFRFDADSGELEPAGLLSFGDSISRGKPADLLINSEGSCVYMSVRGANRILVFGLSAGGEAELRQDIDCGGDYPHGLSLTPDGRFLLCCNRDSGHIAVFSVAADGRLGPAHRNIPARLPGSVVFGPEI